MLLLNLPLFMFKLMFLFLSNNFIYMFINIRFNFNIIRVLSLNRWCYLPSQFILYKLSVHLQFFLIYNIVYFFHSHPFFWQHFPLCNYFFNNFGLTSVNFTVVIFTWYDFTSWSIALTYIYRLDILNGAYLSYISNYFNCV